MRRTLLLAIVLVVAILFTFTVETRAQSAGQCMAGCGASEAAAGRACENGEDPGDPTCLQGVQNEYRECLSFCPVHRAILMIAKEAQKRRSSSPSVGRSAGQCLGGCGAAETAATKACQYEDPNDPDCLQHVQNEYESCVDSCPVHRAMKEVEKRRSLIGSTFRSVRRDLVSCYNVCYGNYQEAEGVCENRNPSAECYSNAGTAYTQCQGACQNTPNRH